MKTVLQTSADFLAAIRASQQKCLTGKDVLAYAAELLDIRQQLRARTWKLSLVADIDDSLAVIASELLRLMGQRKLTGHEYLTIARVLFICCQHPTHWCRSIKEGAHIALALGLAAETQESLTAEDRVWLLLLRASTERGDVRRATLQDAVRAMRLVTDLKERRRMHRELAFLYLRTGQFIKAWQAYEPYR